MSPPASVELTRQQKADAVREIKALLSQVRTDWTYVPAPPPAPPPQPSPASGLSRGLSLRSAALGSWRASEPAGVDALVQANGDGNKIAEEDGEDGDGWYSDGEGEGEEGEESDDTLRLGITSDEDDEEKKLSYRRKEPEDLLQPKPKKKRRRARRAAVPKGREGEWRVREDDSDFNRGDGDVPGVKKGKGGGGAHGNGEGRLSWEGPESVPSGAERRRREEEENPGLKIWRERRQQWTGARGEWVPVGESRFKNNPLSKLVNEGAYRDIYARCVVRGNELPVPVNLKDMTACLVQGWQDDDQWPPKSSVPPEISGVPVLPPPPKAEPSGKVGRVRRLFGVR